MEIFGNKKKLYKDKETSDENFSILSDSGITTAVMDGTKDAMDRKKVDVQEVNKDEDVIKYCALTFDDGPDAAKTPLVLDKLKTHSVVASFFVVGCYINNSTKFVLDRAIKMGCEIHNHSWTHKSMSQMTPDEIKESVDKTTRAIQKYAGVTPVFFRPPNMDVSDVMYDAINLPFAGGVLGSDWFTCNTTALQRAEIVLDRVTDGAIIILHDVQPDPHPTPEALDIIIPELKKRGYQLLTLTGLFAKKGITPDPTARKMWEYVPE